MNKNIVILGGRLSTTPIYTQKSGPNGEDRSRAFFRLAVTRRHTLGRPRAEQETDFHAITAWGKTATNIARHVDKGDTVLITGELRTDVKREEGKIVEEYTGVVVQEIQFVGKALKNQNRSAAPAAAEQQSDDDFAAAAEAGASGDDDPFKDD